MIEKGFNIPRLEALVDVISLSSKRPGFDNSSLTRLRRGERRELVREEKMRLRSTFSPEATTASGS